MGEAKKKIENQVPFAVCVCEDGVPMIILGITPLAVEYIKDGKTQNFDLTKAGIPFRVMMFGADSKKSALDTLDKAIRAIGMPYWNMTDTDFNHDIKN